MKRVAVSIVALLLAGCVNPPAKKGKSNGDNKVVLSPPPERMAFCSTRDGSVDLYLALPDGSAASALTDDDVQEGQPSFSPDGTQLVFVSDAGDAFQLHVMSIDAETGAGGDVVDLDSGLDAVGAPAWSPDGTTLVFHGRTAFDQPNDIYSMPSDGSALPTQLTDDADDDSYPVFTPDGAHVMFVTQRDGAGSVWTMDANGDNEAAVVTGAGFIGRVALAPDGGALAGTRSGETPEGQTGAVTEVVLMTLPSGDVQVLSAHNDADPAFTRAGDYVGVMSFRTGSPEIFAVPVDGGETLQLTSVDGIDSDVAFSP